MHDQTTLRSRRGPRILAALVFFAATTAGLHALSHHYGWRHSPWGSHHFAAERFCDEPNGLSDRAQPPSVSKQPSSLVDPL